MAVNGRKVQGDVTVGVAYAGVGTSCQQDVHTILLSIPSRVVQTGAALGIPAQSHAAQQGALSLQRKHMQQ